MAQLNEQTEQTGSTARFLRTTAVWTFIPALAFNIAHGVAFHSPLPALGLIPHAFSVVLASYELGWWGVSLDKSQYQIRLQDDQNKGTPFSLHPFINTILHAVFGFSLLGCIIGAYVEITSRSGWYYYSNSSEMLIVGTYATLPYIVNALIHGFFLLKGVREALAQRATMKQQFTCPNCHGCLYNGSIAKESLMETATASV